MSIPATSLCLLAGLWAKRGSIAALLCLVTGIFVAGGATASEEVLRLFYWQAPTIVNPHLSPGTKDLSASRIVYEPLASFAADGTLVPFLAQEIPTIENGGVAADGTSVTWKLRQDVKWADGEPFTAADVVFTYNYIRNPDVQATSRSSYDAVAEVEAIDDYTVRVRFTGTNPAWAQPFVGVYGMILPEHIFEPYNGPNAPTAPANRIAIGTGPFYVDEFREEDILLIGDDVVSTIKIVYVRNPYFREADAPHFDRVELQGGGGDAMYAARVIEEGAADFSWNLAVTDDVIEEMEASGRGTAASLFGAWTERIMLNFTDPAMETDSGERANIAFPHPILSDIRVREALSFAIDREAIADLYGRSGKLTTNLLVSPENYDSPNTTWTRNVVRASALLDEAGWGDTDGDGIRDKDGQPLHLLFQTSINPQRQATQEIVRQNLGEIGIDVELKTIDASVFFGPVTESTNTRRHFYADLEEYAFSNKSPNPDAYMQAWTCAEIAQMENSWAKSNWARYCNPDYDALFELSRAEIDPDRRTQLFIDMNDLLIDDAAVIPLVHLIDLSGVAADIAGVDLTPWDVEVWNIKDWRRVAN